MAKLLRLPLKELTTPKDGYIVYLDRYWLVDEEDHALFAGDFTRPWCNSNKRVTLSFQDNRPLKTSIQFIPVAYVETSLGTEKIMPYDN